MKHLRIYLCGDEFATQATSLYGYQVRVWRVHEDGILKDLSRPEAETAQDIDKPPVLYGHMSTAEANRLLTDWWAKHLAHHHGVT